MLVRFYCVDTGQTIALNPKHVVKVSNKPSSDTTSKWLTYINTSDGGTIRVMESWEDVSAKIEAAALEC